MRYDFTGIPTTALPVVASADLHELALSDPVHLHLASRDQEAGSAGNLQRVDAQDVYLSHSHLHPVRV